MEYYADGTENGGIRQTGQTLRAEAQTLCEKIEAEEEKRESLQAALARTEELIGRFRALLCEIEGLLT